MTIQQTTLAAQTATVRVPRVSISAKNRHVPLVGSTLLAMGVALAAANLRPAVTSLASVLGDVRSALGVSAAWTSALTAVPALCFGFAAFAAPWLGRRLGMARAVGLSLAVLTLGLVLRVIDGPWVVLGGTFIACAGIAVSNVLIPVVVKDSFPARVGLLTGVYTAALAAGAAVAAAATPRLEELIGSWRGAVGAWALLSTAALVVWFAGARHGAPTRTSGVRASGSSGSKSLWASPLAWVITVFFGLQSLFAYTVMGWLPQILGDAGVDRNTAGLLLAVSMLLSVPVSLIVPPIAARQRSQVGMVLLLGLLSFAGIAGLLVAPTVVPALWVVLIGLGMGMFPLALLILSLRTRSTSDTARLSAMAQSVGYLIAATGPFAFGVLREVTGTWSIALVVQLVLLGALTAFGVIAGRPRFV